MGRTLYLLNVEHWQGRFCRPTKWGIENVFTRGLIEDEGKGKGNTVDGRSCQTARRIPETRHHDAMTT